MVSENDHFTKNKVFCRAISSSAWKKCSQYLCSRDGCARVDIFNLSQFCDMIDI